MLKPLRIHRNQPEPRQEETLPMEFGLLCWNVHKQNLGYAFDHYFGEMLESYAIDLVALQEVKINPLASSSFEAFDFSFAPNIQFFKHVYGVLNGSRVQEQKMFSLLSAHRESLIRTRKSAIFSYYPLYNGDSLLLVNLHAINFRATKVYMKEIETIFEQIRHHQGAMIVTGDFNSWNRQRISFLMNLCGALELKNIELDHGHLVKSFMSCKLDHIFYRGLKVQESCAIDVKKFSDHNALYARFICI
ncbi:endonuclease/exonuclease/phosphatase family protein [Sulfuricurvum sp.]|uniref:endonuclease/exonuclease/phosphatase family protein n=1 Tax=Sulfuricurvum sp. TaxID=2025608 RepID=UPI003BAE1A20